MSPATIPAIDPAVLFPFELDEFQRRAIAALDRGSSVVVCVPTGSGKTLVGEYAIHRAIASGRRVFYTTPLKALSNQKLRDFRNTFGEDNVGLLTGDASVNREAPVLVMTTEIFRNMLYGTPIGEVGTSLSNVAAVVLDECHYMNDQQRGTVWEECIIYCPTNIQLVALSATIANSRELTDWIAAVHGPTELVRSDFRPVPLEYSFCTSKGFFPLLSANGKKLNPNIKTGTKKKGKKPETPTIANVVSHLKERDMLPAIYFIFSRRGCDSAVAASRNLKLTSPSKQKQLKQLVDEFAERNPEAVRADRADALKRGIAAHHAGILPAWKNLVEELFQMGLIEVVFATETLAAGINMPARTTVISSLSKRTDRGHRLLRASEFLQMSGRAGRRGMDDRGYVVTVQTQFEGAKEASLLARADSDPLVSQFAPSYGMVLNLLQNHTIEEAQSLVERSFGRFVATLHLQPQQEEIALKEAEFYEIQEQLGAIAPGHLASYQKLFERRKIEVNLLKTLKSQAEDTLASETAIALSFAACGTYLSLKGKHVPTKEPIPSVLVAKIPNDGRAPYLICLGQDNCWRVAACSDVAALHGEIPRLTAVDTLARPTFDPPRPGRQLEGNGFTATIAERIPTMPVPRAPELDIQQQRVFELEEEMRNHPLNQFGSPKVLLKRYRRATALDGEILAMRDRLDRQLARRWEEFLALIRVLRSFGALDDVTPAPLGETAAAIRGDNELWLSLALGSGALDALEPPQLAATCAALTIEVSRPDSWTNYVLSPEADEVLAELWDLRKKLIKIQNVNGVDTIVLPVKWQDRMMMAIVEQWAAGTEWLELCENASLDEGDIIRILRRTLDFLSQIPHVPHLSALLKQNAVIARRAIDRFPVSETIE